MDFGKAGLKEGFIKALKVIGYVAASGAITALIGYVAQFKDSSDYAYVYMIVNPLLVWVKTWLETKTK